MKKNLNYKPDMGYKPRPYEYKLPEVLSSALSRFYSKPLTKPRDSLVIDDKMGKTFWKNRKLIFTFSH